MSAPAFALAAVAVVLALAVGPYYLWRWYRERTDQSLGMALLTVAIIANSAFTISASAGLSNSLRSGILALNVVLLAVASYFMWRGRRGPVPRP